MKKRVAILGATGSIGQQTLAVIRLHPEQFEVVALTAQRRVQELRAQCVEFNPRFAVIDAAHATALQADLKAAGCLTRVLAGPESLIEVASHSEVDTVVAAIVGARGLPSTLAAARHGKTLLLANKEALVMGGHLLIKTAAEAGANLIPIDSEHNAIFQCWTDTRHPDSAALEKVLLTASGGPFLGKSSEYLKTVTPQAAVSHPNWSMGPKISVDSATLANKALELMEAHYLFQLPFEQLGVLIHPQSKVHAWVAYRDGSILSHLGVPDMRIAISYALGWPKRIASGVNSSALWENSLTLTFEPLKKGLFPCFDLAMQAVQSGSAGMITFNAANEVAVEAFLAGEIAFIQIPVLVEASLNAMQNVSLETITDILNYDTLTRNKVNSLMEKVKNYA